MTLRRHALSYAAIGVLQWLVEYGLMLALFEWVMPVEPANVIGRLAGACLGFWLNGKWTFAGEDTHLGRHAALRFVAMWLALTVVNTWLVYLRFQQMRGVLTREAYEREVALVRESLGAIPAPHWQEFLAAWPGN